MVPAWPVAGIVSQIRSNTPVQKPAQATHWASFAVPAMTITSRRSKSGIAVNQRPGERRRRPARQPNHHHHWGLAAAQFSANASDGGYTVTASAAGVLSATFTLANDTIFNVCLPLVMQHAQAGGSNLTARPLAAIIGPAQPRAAPGRSKAM